MKDTLSTSLTLDQINDDYSAYQEELTLREKRLRLLVSYQFDEIDDILNLLSEAYVIEDPKTKELIKTSYGFDITDGAKRSPLHQL